MKKNLFTKLAVCVSALLILTVAPAFATGGGNGNGSAYDDASGYGWAADPDQSYSQSWYGNDYAGAYALGGGGFSVFAETWGNKEAFAQVFGIGKGYADTCTFAWDSGLTSAAGAVSTVEGWAFAEGFTAAGRVDWRGRGVDSHINGDTFFDAQVDQYNEVAEVGYIAGGIGAGNSSFVHGINGRSFEDNSDFYGLNYEDGYTEGIATTRGFSTVTIDPYGNYRSIRGETETSSYFDTNHRGDGAVMIGYGGIGGNIENQYGAVAGGSAHFDYFSPYTDSARGGADLNAQIMKTSGSTTVTVNASSYSRIGD